MQLVKTWCSIGAEIREDVLDALYPRTCVLCGVDAEDGVACSAHRLPREPAGPRCRTCAARLPPALAGVGRCASCRRQAPGFAELVALGDYREDRALGEWILAFKHGGRAQLAEPLGRALAQRWIAAGAHARAGPQLFVPVPLHFVRRIERGYDQAALLAGVACRVANVAVLGALARARATTVQGAPGAVSRAANVRDAFRGARWPLGVSARLATASRVWIVDDVVTSCATVRECARTLRRLGARDVAVLALARAGGEEAAMEP